MTFPGFPDAAPLDFGAMSFSTAGVLTARLFPGDARRNALAIAILFGAAEPIEAVFPPHWGWLVAGGLFVGYGTRLGSGCTSGHGVCGMSRLSPRSLVATGVFMASGIATVALVNALGYGW